MTHITTGIINWQHKALYTYLTLMNMPQRRNCDIFKKIGKL